MSESENYLEAMAAPLSYTIPGVGDVSFPVCNSEDFAPWVSDIHKAKKAFAEKKIQQLTSNVQDQLEALWRVEHDVPGLGEVSKEIYTVAGARKVLVLSLTRHIPLADRDERARARTEAAAKVRKIPDRDVVELGQRASGLFVFRNPEPSDPKKDEEPSEEPSQSETELPAEIGTLT